MMEGKGEARRFGDLTGFTALAYDEWKKGGVKVAQMYEIKPDELQSRLEKGEHLTLVDVREPDEVASGIIPGAIHIPMGQIPERFHELDSDAEIIFICRSGNRSGRVCEYLAANGFAKATNLVGGMLNWSGDVE